MKKIQYKNKTIAYTVCKAKVKNLYISIQNGEVVVKAPWYVTSNQIQEVIEQKRRWIIEKIEEYQNSPRKAKTYTDGEKYQILGKKYYLNIYLFFFSWLYYFHIIRNTRICRHTNIIFVPNLTSSNIVYTSMYLMA